MSFEFISILSEVACLAVALFCLVRDEDPVWRSMVFFLIITCITEIFGLIIKWSHHQNPWLYNIFLVFEASFTSLMFGNLLNRYIKSKALILSGLVLIFLLYAYEVLNHGFLIFNDNTATLMSVIFVFYSFYYYFLLIKDDMHIDLKHDAPFWWVAGSLFFYFGSTACNLFYKQLKGVIVGGHSFTFLIFVALGILLYGCWSYSFICRRWLTTSKS